MKSLSRDELNLVFALTYRPEVRAVIDNGEDALCSELERWEPDTRAVLARVLAEVA